MGLFELLMIAVGLSMDAFAVSLCKGLSMRRLNYIHALVIAVFFGMFQAIMPLIGWVLGKQFESYIVSIDHWIAFALLAFIGGKMIYEAINDKDETCEICALDIKELFVLAVATSIDALAVGITFAFLIETSIAMPVIIIGLTTFAISAIGVVLGNKIGSGLGGKAAIFGGIVLILIGIKILLEHLEIIAF